MRHEEFGGLQDVYFFELPAGSVGLTIDHRPSPMGGHQVSLQRFDGPPATRPSDVGVAGFDQLWDEGFTIAYGVSSVTVAELVDRFTYLEGAPQGV